MHMLAQGGGDQHCGHWAGKGASCKWL